MTDVRLGLEMTSRIALERTFVETYLPLTIELARRCKQLLEPLLPAQTAKWPFEDRILVELVPSLLDEVVRYYHLDGPDLLRLFSVGGIAAVEHLDKETVRLLVAKLKEIVPEAYPQTESPGT